MLQHCFEFAPIQYCPDDFLVSDFIYRILIFLKANDSNKCFVANC